MAVIHPDSGDKIIIYKNNKMEINLIHQSACQIRIRCRPPRALTYLRTCGASLRRPLRCTVDAQTRSNKLLGPMMGLNMPPVKDDGYLLLDSITEASQHCILKSVVQTHFTIRTERKIIINHCFPERTRSSSHCAQERCCCAGSPVALGGNDILIRKETIRT